MSNQQMIVKLRDSELENSKLLSNLSNNFVEIDGKLKKLALSYDKSIEILNKYSGVSNMQSLTQIREYVSVSRSSLMWSNNVSEAIIFLSAAYRLANSINDPDFSHLAGLINGRIGILKGLRLEVSGDFYSQVAYLDTVFSAMNFDNISDRAKSSNMGGALGDDSNSFWENFWFQLQKKFHDFVRIDHDDCPNLRLLTVEEKDFVRQMVHLHTLSLRLSWAIHDKDMYQSSLNKISSLANRYFSHDENYKKFNNLIVDLSKFRLISNDVIDMSDMESFIDVINRKQRNGIVLSSDSVRSEVRA